MKTIRFYLTDRGLGSEVIFLINTILLAEFESAKIEVNDNLWNSNTGNGWGDYFEQNNSFVINNSFGVGYSTDFKLKQWKGLIRTIKYSYLIDWVKNGKGQLVKGGLKYIMPFFRYITSNFKNENEIIGQKLISIDGIKENILWNKVLRISLSYEFQNISITDSRSKIANDLWRINNLVQKEINTSLKNLKYCDGDYIGVHIRRGDKLINEANKVGVIDFIKLIEKMNLSSENIFIATDDYSVINEFIELRPRWKIKSLVTNHENGHLQSDFNSKSNNDIKKNTISVINDIEILKNSKVYIGSITSNFTKLISILRNNYDSTYSIDSRDQKVFDTYKSYINIIPVTKDY